MTIRAKFQVVDLETALAFESLESAQDYARLQTGLACAKPQSLASYTKLTSAIKSANAQLAISAL